MKWLRCLIYVSLVSLAPLLLVHSAHAGQRIQFRLIDIQPSKLRVIDPNLTPQQHAKKQADELVKRLRDGNDFAELAKVYSHGPRHSFGGLWKPVDPESLAKPYDILGQYAEKMNPGDITEPIEAPGHIFIMKLEYRRAKDVRLKGQLLDAVAVMVDVRPLTTHEVAKAQQIRRQLSVGKDIKTAEPDLEQVVDEFIMVHTLGKELAKIILQVVSQTGAQSYPFDKISLTEQEARKWYQDGTPVDFFRKVSLRAQELVQSGKADHHYWAALACSILVESMEQVPLPSNLRQSQYLVRYDRSWQPISEEFLEIGLMIGTVELTGLHHLHQQDVLSKINFDFGEPFTFDRLDEAVVSVCKLGWFKDAKISGRRNGSYIDLLVEVKEWSSEEMLSIAKKIGPVGQDQLACWLTRMAVATTPKSRKLADVILEAADLQTLINHHQCAANIYHTFLQNFPDDKRLPEIYIKIAQELEKAEKWDNAAQHYEYLGDKYPDSTEAQEVWTSLARLYRHQLGDYQRALSAYTKWADLVRGTIKEPEVRCAIIECLFEKGEQEAAQNKCQEFLTTYPEHKLANKVKQWIELAPQQPEAMEALLQTVGALEDVWNTGIQTCKISVKAHLAEGRTANAELLYCWPDKIKLVADLPTEWGKSIAFLVVPSQTQLYFTETNDLSVYKGQAYPQWSLELRSADEPGFTGLLAPSFGISNDPQPLAPEKPFQLTAVLRNKYGHHSPWLRLIHDEASNEDVLEGVLDKGKFCVRVDPNSLLPVHIEFVGEDEIVEVTIALNKPIPDTAFKFEFPEEGVKTRHVSNPMKLFSSMMSFVNAVKATAAGVSTEPEEQSDVFGVEVAKAFFELIGRLFEADECKKKQMLPEAEQLYLSIIDTLPSFSQAYVGLADLYVEMNKPEMALKAASKAVELGGLTAIDHSTLGECYSKIGRVNEAEEAILKMVEMQPDNTYGYTQLGTFYWRQSQYDKAEAAYKRGLKLAPSDGVLHLLLAQCYRDAEQYNDAIVSYQDAFTYCDSNERKASILDTLGTIYKSLYEFDKSIEAYIEGLSFAEKPKDVGRICGNMAVLALWLTISGDTDGALNLCNIALKHDPENAKAMSGKAFAVFHKKDYIEAHKLLDRALKIGAKEFEICYDESMTLIIQAHVYLYEGKTEKALEAAEQAVKINMRDLYCHSTLAEAYVHTGQYREAVELLKPMLEKQSEFSADVYYWYGHALINLGQREEGLKFIEKAVNEMPFAVEYKQGLDMLREMDQ